MPVLDLKPYHGLEGIRLYSIVHFPDDDEQRKICETYIMSTMACNSVTQLNKTITISDKELGVLLNLDRSEIYEEKLNAIDNDLHITATIFYIFLRLCNMNIDEPSINKAYFVATKHFKLHRDSVKKKWLKYNKVSHLYLAAIIISRKCKFKSKFDLWASLQGDLLTYYLSLADWFRMKAMETMPRNRISIINEEFWLIPEELIAEPSVPHQMPPETTFEDSNKLSKILIKYSAPKSAR